VFGKNTALYRIGLGRVSNFVLMYLCKNWTLIDFFERTVSKHGNKEALVFEERVYTYNELNNLANKIANWADSNNIKQGDVVGLLMRVILYF
jgi:long-chain acyl-CoA synthetase